MKSDEAIKWLVGIAGRDCTALVNGRPGDLANLLYDFRRWLDLEPQAPLNRELERLSRTPARLAAALQPIVDDLTRMLEAVAEGHEFQLPYSGGLAVLDASRLGTQGPRAIVFRRSSLRDTAMRLAFFDICWDARDAKRIRQCREPGCRKIFYAARLQQIYCGHSCANKAASRVYREKNRTLRAARERKRYERRMRRMAPNLRILRRARLAPPEARVDR